MPVAVNDYSPQKCRCKPGAGLVSPVSLLHCPGHTQQEIADAVGMSVGAVNQRTSVCSDLDKCPKVNKIAAHRLLARVGAGGQPQISEGTRRLPGEVLQGSRSGVGLVPVAVNEYSPQKCRCKTGASPVRAGVPPASVGYGGSL